MHFLSRHTLSTYFHKICRRYCIWFPRLTVKLRIFRNMEFVDMYNEIKLSKRPQKGQL